MSPALYMVERAIYSPPVAPFAPRPPHAHVPGGEAEMTLASANPSYGHNPQLRGWVETPNPCQGIAGGGARSASEKARYVTVRGL